MSNIIRQAELDSCYACDKWITEHYIELLAGMPTKLAHESRPNGYKFNYFTEFMKHRCDRIRPRNSENACGRQYVYKLKPKYVGIYALEL